MHMSRQRRRGRQGMFVEEVVVAAVAVACVEVVRAAKLFTSHMLLHLLRATIIRSLRPLHKVTQSGTCIRSILIGRLLCPKIANNG